MRILFFLQNMAICFIVALPLLCGCGNEYSNIYRYVVLVKSGDSIGSGFIGKIDVDKKLTLSTRKSIARFYAYGYGNSTVYYLSNYRNKTLAGLLNSFSFIEPKNFEKNVQKAINSAENV